MKAIPSEHLKTARRACIGLVLAALGAAALALLHLILMDFMDSKPAVRGAMSGVIVLITALLWLANLAVLGRDGRHELAWLAMTAALVGAGFWLIATWRDWNRHADFDLIWQGAICLYLASLGATITGQLMMLTPRRVILHWGRWAAAGALVVGFGLIILLVTGLLDIEDRIGRGIAPIFTTLVVPVNVVALLGVIVVPMLIRMEERTDRRGPVESLDRDVALSMTCPRCGLEQSMKPGVRSCTGCRAVMRVEIEEPRCECGYLLFRLSSPHCPECGRPVPHSGAHTGGSA